jgi:hypothetical protein
VAPIAALQSHITSNASVSGMLGITEQQMTADRKRFMIEQVKGEGGTSRMNKLPGDGQNDDKQGKNSFRDKHTKNQ